MSAVLSSSDVTVFLLLPVITMLVELNIKWHYNMSIFFFCFQRALLYVNRRLRDNSIVFFKVHCVIVEDLCAPAAISSSFLSFFFPVLHIICSQSTSAHVGLLSKQ